MPTGNVGGVRVGLLLSAASLIVALLAVVSSASATPGAFPDGIPGRSPIPDGIPGRPEAKPALALDESQEEPSSRIPGHYIVVLKGSVEHPAAVAEAQTESRDGDLGLIYRSALKGYSASDLTKSDVESLREDPRVKSVEPDRRVEAMAQTTPDGVKRIGAATNPALDIDQTDDVRIDADVAVIDTGIDYTHPDLNVVSRTNCVPANEDPEGAEWNVEACVDNTGTDGYGHGTHVAGTIGALDNNIGVVGVAPGARLWAVRVLSNEGSGSTSWIIAGIDWVTAHASQIEVANMSLAGYGRSPAEETAIKASVEAGVVYVVAAGNSSVNASAYVPANDPNVITVSALADSDGQAGGKGVSCAGKDDNLAVFSNWGADVEIAAPGTCIYSTLPVGGSELGANYGELNGTSMATPHVAGAAAVLAAKSNPNSKKDVETIRQTLIDDASLEWEDSMGDGRFEPLLYLGAEPLKSLEVGTGGWATDATKGTTVTGAINPRGQKAEYRFEYGPTTSYGSSAPASPGIKEGKYAALSQQLEGLELGKAYHYRLSATTASGTVYGKDRTVTPSLWSKEAPSGVPTSQFEELYDVSCATESSCVAVGWRYNENEPPWNILVSYKLAEGKWTHVAPPIPAGGSFPRLDAVSCKSATSCIAVGKVQMEGQVVVPLAESWDGSKWTSQSIPAPATEATVPYAELEDVSCASTTECIAVGYFKAADVNPEFPKSPLWRAYVAQWKGGTWSNSYPLAANAGFMESISCTSASFCASAAGNRMMVWNGSSWASQALDAEAYVRDVSCTSQTFCLAISYQRPEIWDGTEWSTAPPPKEESTTSETTLSNVACLSPSDCVASGYGLFPSIPFGGSGTYAVTPAIEVWNGTEMQSQATLRDTEEFAAYGGIDCNPSHTCVAVGTTVGEKIKQLIASAPNRLPSVTSEAASSVATSHATLNGTANPNGLATTYRFEWGSEAEFLKGKYGHSVPVPAEAIGSGKSAVKVAQTLNGLDPGTKYHFRLLAQNAGGPSAGADQTFTTPDLRPQIAYQLPVGIGRSEATLTAAINPKGFATSYRFEWGPTTAYGHSIPVPDAGIGSGEKDVAVKQGPLTGLAAHAEYHFRVVASNAEGTSYGADQAFTTGSSLRWFACTKQAGGKYNSSACSKEAAPKEWELLRLKEAEKTTITAKGNPIAFTATISGVLTTFSCETEVLSASLENPSGGGNGIGNAEVKYKGCKPEGTAAEKGCKVENTANFASKAELTTLEGKPQLVLKPTTGEVFAKFSFSGCSIGALNGTYELKGMMRGLYSNSASKVEFNAETTAEGLTLRGQKATAVGSIGLTASGGGQIKAEPAQPAATTEAATAIEPTKATLQGSVNPEGADTKYRFEYGKTTAYGQSVPLEAKSVGEGFANVKASEAISGLTPGTLYHYRLVAISGVYTAYGADATFTTTAAPLRWFACTKQTGGKYTSSACSKEGAPKEWEWLRLKAGEKTTITAKGNPIAFTATISGVKTTFSCETEVLSASLENPSGGGNGIGNAEVKYKGCKPEGTAAEKGCKVENTANFASKAELVTVEAKPQVVLKPTSGEVFAKFSFSGCSIGALNGTYELKGTFRGAYSNSASKVEFNLETTAEGLTLRGQKATAVGSIGLETSAGGYVKAAAQPAATTEAATAIEPTKATLQGSVNPEGADTKYQFEYGKTTAYGQSVPVEAKGVGEGIANVKVSEAISGLTPGTLYHYRLVATSIDTGYGADMTFTTSAAPLYWYGCTQQSGGRFTNGECAKEGAPNEWESIRLKAGEKTTIAAKGNPIAFTATISGVLTTFSCETEVLSASLENPSGGGNGIGNAEVKYKGCKPEGTAAEKGCKVENTANFASKLELTTVEAKAQVLLKPSSGEVFAKFSFSGCSIGALNGTYELKGTFRGAYSNSASKVEFNAETTAEGLTLRGQKATAIGSIGLETSGGGYIKQETALYWYGCAKQAGGKYASSTCTTEGAPNEWESLLLKAGEKTTVTAKGSPIALSATLTGISGTLSCETEVLGASLENPSGGGSGTGNAQVKYKSCKAEGTWGEKGCKVEPTASFTSKLELITVAGKTEVLLTPSEGTTFATFSFSGCTIGALNGSWSLSGTARALYSNTASRLELNAETTEGLTLRGQKTTTEGSIGLETTGAGAVRAE